MAALLSRGCLAAVTMVAPGSAAAKGGRDLPLGLCGRGVGLESGGGEGDDGDGALDDAAPPVSGVADFRGRRDPQPGGGRGGSLAGGLQGLEGDADGDEADGGGGPVDGWKFHFLILCRSGLGGWCWAMSAFMGLGR